MHALLAVILSLGLHADNAAAIRDREQFPADQWVYLYYATTWQAESPEAQHNEAVALKLAFAQISPSPVIEHATPQQIGPTLYRLDCRRLAIHPDDMAGVTAANPYERSGMLSPASWLTLQVSDANRRPEAYYPLCTGGYDAKGVLQPGIVPKTRDQWLARLRVDTTRTGAQTQIEGESGVALSGRRWLESRTMIASRGKAWGTRDSRDLVGASDPLESPIGNYKHDAEEWIVWRPKASETTGAQGLLPVYAIFDGAGALARAAPPDIVEDHTHFRGSSQIVAPGSCIQCHLKGAQLPTRDAFKELLASGVRRIDQYDQARQITEAMAADKLKELHRIQEDHGAAVVMATGEESGEAAACFHATIDKYLEPIDLATAARWHHIDPERLRDVLARAATRGAIIPASVLTLAHGGKCERLAFEESFLAVRNEIELWTNEVAAQQKGAGDESAKPATAN